MPREWRPRKPAQRSSRQRFRSVALQVGSHRRVVVDRGATCLLPVDKETELTDIGLPIEAHAYWCRLRTCLPVNVSRRRAVLSWQPSGRTGMRASLRVRGDEDHSQQ
jgi:hypothetical protein